MKLTPYVQVDDVPFTSQPEDLRARGGAPGSSSRNGVGLDELDYGDSVYRFQHSGRLEEVAQRVSVIQLPQASVPFAFLKGFVQGQDPTAFERAGFIVSPRFGFAFAPDSPP